MITKPIEKEKKKKKKTWKNQNRQAILGRAHLSTSHSDRPNYSYGIKTLLRKWPQNPKEMQHLKIVIRRICVQKKAEFHLNSCSPNFGNWKEKKIFCAGKIFFCTKKEKNKICNSPIKTLRELTNKTDLQSINIFLLYYY